MKDLGCITNVEVIQKFVDLQNKSVVDAGCGSMVFTKHLVELGANVVAVDPDATQAIKNRKNPIENVEFVESCASEIPIESSSMDGVFFSYSLHHIPESLYPKLFQEILRVLTPDGFVYVIEPIDCPLNQVMKHFHDEDQERAVAWQSLEAFGQANFRSCESVTYHGHSEYGSWDEFADNFASRSFNDCYSEEDVRKPAVEEAYKKFAGPNGRFQSPKNVMFLSRLKV